MESRWRHLRTRRLYSRLGGRDFIPGGTLEKTLAVLQDYDHHKNIYKDVPESKLLSRAGNDFKYYRLRVLKKGPINGVFRTEFEAHYQAVDPVRWVCQTGTTRVTEIEDYGKPEQRELPPGRGSGYLWKLNARPFRSPAVCPPSSAHFSSPPRTTSSARA